MNMCCIYSYTVHVQNCLLIKRWSYRWSCIIPAVHLHHVVFRRNSKLVSISMRTFYQCLSVDVSDGHKLIRIANTQDFTCLPALHLSSLFGATLRSLKSTSSLIFTHCLKKQSQVLTGMLLADPSADLSFLPHPTGVVNSVPFLLFVCIQLLHVICLKRFSDHFHANDS